MVCLFQIYWFDCKERPNFICFHSTLVVMNAPQYLTLFFFVEHDFFSIKEKNKVGVLGLCQAIKVE